jgi:hypothetical protein
MSDNFYITLPSNSSAEFFPDNKTTNFTLQLHQRIVLSDQYEVGIVEFHYPQTYLNVNANNIIYYRKIKHNIKKYKIPHGYYLITDIIKKINKHPEIGNFLKLKFENNRVESIPYNNVTYATNESVINMTEPRDHKLEIDHVSLSGKLALLLKLTLI